MSLVGPRPQVEQDVKLYTKKEKELMHRKKRTKGKLNLLKRKKAVRYAKTGGKVGSGSTFVASLYK